ncbi:MAG: protein-L-isoaspartate O-methyltransferase [Gammaproteobacteria bacterium SHHR-1]|uniref:protein-L-isoaspartate O-methyltransferase family protein n=1 Tax=Magnetovirga frankeli TaxID=947516 RepID=UPI00129385A5|nr:protein-L-isoaspartate O-methyltransferase [gamma proteobacterium SS-5]
MHQALLETARHNMIMQQIRPWSPISDRVLETLQSIPREDFVPAAYRNLAFADLEIPLAGGRCLPPPRVEARMLDALAIRANDNILEIGTGNGYLSACLARLGGYVTSIDSNPDYSAEAGKRLARLGIHNISLSRGDVQHLPGGSFDVILLNAGALQRRHPGLEQALVPGGRLFAVIGQAPAMQACLIRRSAQDQWQCQALFETQIPLLEEAPAQAQGFSF